MEGWVDIIYEVCVWLDTFLGLGFRTARANSNSPTLNLPTSEHVLRRRSRIMTARIMGNFLFRDGSGGTVEERCPCGSGMSFQKCSHKFISFLWL